MNFPTEQYDLVLSKLVLHYIEDLTEIFQRVSDSLRAAGAFVFSVEHPIITSCYDAYHQDKNHQHWIVDNYFVAGPRENLWLGANVIKYHRTFEDYFNLFQQAGLTLESLRESKPERRLFENVDEYERRRRIPLFLVVRVGKH